MRFIPKDEPDVMIFPRFLSARSGQCRFAMPRFFVLMSLALSAPVAYAACEAPVAYIVSLQGQVEFSAPGRSEWHPASVGQGLCAGELLTVRRQSRAAVQFEGDVLTRLDQFTTLEIAATPRNGDVALGLSEGIAHVISRLRKQVEVITPVVNALVEGTEFTVVAKGGQAQVVVAEGQVKVSNPQGELRLAAGQSAQIAPGAAPASILVRPLDAVHWAIYYPMIMWPDAPALAESKAAAARGDFNAALALIAPADSDAVAVYRANLLLGLGRADEAGELLDGLPQTLPNQDAVRAVMLLAQGRFAQARGVLEAEASDTYARLMAKSLGLQSEGHLESALVMATEAARLAPANPLAWARKAELELTLGDAAAAQRSAEQALSLQPGTAHAQALQGFAMLLQQRLVEARETLDAAVIASPADPLARFALAMAQVRLGELSAGRRSLEIAVLLDPSNVEYRAMLGRAYMGEGKDAFARRQLELAHSIDPASPTPLFLEAQRKLAQGDVLGSMLDGEQAMAANGARLSLRTPAMLDSDHAARGSTLGAAHLMAGFEGSLKSIAAEAVEADARNAAAHRLMARALTNDRRLEQARVSEQLQGFAYGRVGDPVVAPETLVARLPALQGARLSSLHETTALFDPRPTPFDASLLAGSQETYASSLSASAASDRFQAGLGYFNYASDGFVDDGKVDLEALRGEFRWQASSRLGFFADLQHQDLAIRDVTQALYTVYDQTSDEITSDLVRAGLRYKLGGGASVTGLVVNEYGREGSYVHQPTRTISIGPFTFDSDDSEYSEGSVARRGAEVRLDGTLRSSDYFLGASSFRTKRDTDFRAVTVTTGFFGSTTTSRYKLRDDALANRIAAGGRTRLGYGVDLVSRADYVRYESERIKTTTTDVSDLSRRDAERVLPSIGLVSNDWLGTTFRAAFIQNVATPTAGDQTLLPTRFAGFETVFDDVPGTRFRRVAVGFDKAFGAGVRAGGEWSQRKMAVSFEMCAVTDCFTHWTERRHSLYLSWPLAKRVGAEVGWQYYSLGLKGVPVGTYQPRSVRTEALPLRMFVQWSGSIRTLAEVVRVRQDVNTFQPGASQRHNASFWVTNLRLEYGKPGGRWGAGLEVRNLFDQDALIQDTDLVTAEPRTPMWYPERSIFLTGRASF